MRKSKTQQTQNRSQIRLKVLALKGLTPNLDSCQNKITELISSWIEYWTFGNVFVFLKWIEWNKMCNWWKQISFGQNHPFYCSQESQFLRTQFKTTRQQKEETLPLQFQVYTILNEID